MFISWRQFNVKGAAAYIQFIRYVFNSFAKASSDRALLRTASGKPFQTRLEQPNPKQPKPSRFLKLVTDLGIPSVHD